MAFWLGNKIASDSARIADLAKEARHLLLIHNFEIGVNSWRKAGIEDGEVINDLGRKQFAFKIMEGRFTALYGEIVSRGKQAFMLSGREQYFRLRIAVLGEGDASADIDPGQGVGKHARKMKETLLAMPNFYSWRDQMATILRPSPELED